MKNEMFNSWFLIHNYVYVNVDENGSLFLYDTKSGKHLTSLKQQAKDLVDAIYSPNNLGVVDLDAFVTDDETNSFIASICQNKMGVLIDKEQCPQKPLNFLPILNLQNDIERMSEIGEYIMVGEILNHYLTRAVIHLNTNCGKHCPQCGIAYRQTLCCTATEPPQAMPLERLKELVGQLAATSVQVIDLVGGDLRTYPHLDQLHALVEQYPQFSWHLWQHGSNGEGFAAGKAKTDVLLSAPFVTSDGFETLRNNPDARFHLLVENEMQVEQAERLVAGIEAERCEWVPVFNGENLKFFEDNVFLDEDDITSCPVSMREIFCHQKLNTNYFGTLHFFADGELKADVNAETVGRFPDKSVLELVYEELTRNTAWRRTRGGERCSVCRYRFLCPSPGNYETAIGKENLCKIKSTVAIEGDA